MATNANGYMDATHYQVYAPLTASSKLEVTATATDVKIQKGPVVGGRAIVRCTYKGKEKVFLIN